jgi:transcriptional regulator with XRE-family HTH domain
MKNYPRAVRLRLGRNIRELRLLRDLTQERFAELVGHSNKTISRIELGSINVTIDVLSDIAAGLSVDVADLFRAQSSDAASTRPGHGFGRRELDVIDRAVRDLQSLKRSRRRRASSKPA